MKLKSLMLLLFTAFFASCGNQNVHSDADHSHSDHQKEHHHDPDEADLRLNNGEKWLVNSEMMVFVKSSENLVNRYDASGELDHRELAAKLNQNNNDLIENCTMDGEAHDELHKWLVPHLDLVEELMHTESEEEAKDIIHHLNLSFKTFNTYFK
jgi:hypothetical protein